MTWVVDRFLDKVDVSGGSDSCWLWQAYVDRETDYGEFSFNGKPEWAHRVSYMLFVGPIPDGHSVLHRCDVRRCVNPYHLFTGTHLDNMADMAAKDRGRKSKILKAADVTSIRNDSRPQREIAAIYGVSQTLIWGIKVGRRMAKLGE